MPTPEDSFPQKRLVSCRCVPEMDSSSSEVQLSVIYVNWNSLDFLERSIASVLRYTPATTLEIIVVDNASPEGGLEKIATMASCIRIVPLRENMGFARANNLGAGHACGHVLLFLNPDTELTGAAIATMLEHLESLPDAGMLGCRLLNADGSVQLSTIQLFPTILNQILDSEVMRLRWPSCPLWRIEPLFLHQDRPVEVETISGACMMVTKRVFKSVGGFSEDYFMYAEDIDLCYKTATAGLRNYYFDDATMIHYGGCSSSRKSLNQWATRMKFRAMILLLRKMRGNLYATMYRWAMSFTAIVRLALIGSALCLSWKTQARLSLWWSWSKWAAILDASLMTSSDPANAALDESL